MLATFGLVAIDLAWVAVRVGGRTELRRPGAKADGAREGEGVGGGEEAEWNEWQLDDGAEGMGWDGMARHARQRRKGARRYMAGLAGQVCVYVYGDIEYMMA